MRIAFLGSGHFALPTLKWLAASDHEIPLVVTQPAKGSGRGRRTARTPVAATADQLGLPITEDEDVNLSGLTSKMTELSVDLVLVIAFGQKLGPDLINAPQCGCVNLHASLLPKYRGAAPINWAIMRGEPRTGCTVFRLAERMDAGPIISSRSTAIEPEETAGELHDRLAAIGVDAVRDALELFQAGKRPEGQVQDDSLATTAPKLKKSDGLVRFDRGAEEVANHILGVTPWPGASAKFESMDDRWENLQILRARIAEDSTSPDLPPGTVDARRYVAAADGFVEILEVKPTSGRTMGWRDYVNGRHVEAGDRFITPA